VRRATTPFRAYLRVGDNRHLLHREKKAWKTTARDAVKKLLKVFRPATVTADDILKALDLEWNDFEDSVQFAVGTSLSVDCIVTRNAKDFSTGGIPALTPEQLIETIADPA